MNRGVSAILEALANPIRGQVVLSLQKSAVSKYSDLLQACGLDPYSESGKLGYHLQQLISVGLVARDGSTYALTEKGKKASKLMTTVNETSRELFALPDSHAGKPVRKEKIRLREATYSDIGGIVKLWRASLPTDEQPDYFVAELIAGREGIKKQALLHEGSGLGRSTSWQSMMAK